MSDSETKQLHIFMRKGLKGTYMAVKGFPIFNEIIDQLEADQRIRKENTTLPRAWSNESIIGMCDREKRNDKEKNLSVSQTDSVSQLQ